MLMSPFSHLSPRPFIFFAHCESVPIFLIEILLLHSVQGASVTDIYRGIPLGRKHTVLGLYFLNATSSCQGCGSVWKGVPRASSHSLNSICPSIVYSPIWLTMTLMSCYYPSS